MPRQLAGVFCIVVLCALATVQAAELKVAGEVVKASPTSVDVKSPDGRVVPIRVPSDVRLSARSPADLSQLTQGAFVGTTAVPQADGTLIAREVHIFPASMRGRGEGHRPMDNEPGSTMTNATISSVSEGAAASSMTNATVTQVSGARGGRTLKLTYQGGEKTVFVPDTVPVVMVEPADRSLLAPGAHVVAYTEPQADGTLSATRITVGVKGFVPPL